MWSDHLCGQYNIVAVRFFLKIQVILSRDLCPHPQTNRKRIVAYILIDFYLFNWRYLTEFYITYMQTNACETYPKIYMKYVLKVNDQWNKSYCVKYNRSISKKSTKCRKSYVCIQHWWIEEDQFFHMVMPNYISGYWPSKNWKNCCTRKFYLVQLTLPVFSSTDYHFLKIL